MKRIGIRLAYLAALLGVAGTCVSCSRQTSKTPTAAIKKDVKSGPEESFQVIIETFRRRMEQTPIGFVVDNPNGRSSMRGKNEVSYELIRPAKATDPYKAIITVKSQSYYSVKLSADASDETSQNASSSKNNSLLPDSDENGTQSFDPTLGKASADSSKATSTHAGDEVIPREEKEERKYELLYRDGRWSLVTKLDQETEQATQNAFNSALDTQI